MSQKKPKELPRKITNEEFKETITCTLAKKFDAHKINRFIESILAECSSTLWHGKEEENWAQYTHILTNEIPVAESSLTKIYDVLNNTTRGDVIYLVGSTSSEAYQMDSLKETIRVLNAIRTVVKKEKIKPAQKNDAARAIATMVASRYYEALGKTPSHLRPFSTTNYTFENIHTAEASLFDKVCFYMAAYTQYHFSDRVLYDAKSLATNRVKSPKKPSQ